MLRNVVVDTFSRNAILEDFKFEQKNCQQLISKRNVFLWL